MRLRALAFFCALAVDLVEDFAGFFKAGFWAMIFFSPISSWSLPCEVLLGSESQLTQAFLELETIFGDQPQLQAESDSANSDLVAASFAAEALSRVHGRMPRDARQIFGSINQTRVRLDALVNPTENFSPLAKTVFFLNSNLGDLRPRISAIGLDTPQRLFPAPGEIIFAEVVSRKTKIPRPSSNSSHLVVIHGGDPSSSQLTIFDPTGIRSETYTLTAQRSGQLSLRKVGGDLFSAPQSWLWVTKAMRVSLEGPSTVAKEIEALLGRLRELTRLVYQHDRLLIWELSKMTRIQVKTIMDQHMNDLHSAKTIASRGGRDFIDPEVGAAILEIREQVNAFEEVAERLGFWSWLKDNQLIDHDNVIALPPAPLSRSQVVTRLERNALAPRIHEQVKALKAIQDPGQTSLESEKTRLVVAKAIEVYFDLAKELSHIFLSAEPARLALQPLFDALNESLSTPVVSAALGGNLMGINTLGDWRRLRDRHQIGLSSRP